MILLHPFEDLLLAEIGIARRGDRMAAFDTGGRHGRRKWRRRLIARQLRLVRALRGTFIRDDETERAQDRDEPGSIRTKARLHAHDLFFRPPVSYLKPII